MLLNHNLIKTKQNKTKQAKTKQNPIPNHNHNHDLKNNQTENPPFHSKQSNPIKPNQNILISKP